MSDDKNTIVNDADSSDRDSILREKFLDFIANAPTIPDSAWDPELIRLGSAEWVRKLRRQAWSR